jgi:hypothetical protein
MPIQMLLLHWRTVRLPLIPFVLAAFALPLLLIQGMGLVLDYTNQPSPHVLLAQQAEWGLFFPALAGATGLVLGLSAWSWDHKHGHVYALAMPIGRARYALLKFGAGVVLALIPAAALLLGSFVALQTIDVPRGMSGYPVELALHFLFATLVLYAICFSMAAGTIRTTVVVSILMVALPLIATLAVQLIAIYRPELITFDLRFWLTRALEELGPFRILLGNWMLVDV